MDAQRRIAELEAEKEPLDGDHAPVVAPQLAWTHTEDFVDRRLITLSELLERLFGYAIEDHFQAS